MANKFTFLYQMIVLVLILSCIPKALANEKNEILIAYLDSGLSELKNNEKQVGLQLLANELVQNSGYKIRVQEVKSFIEMKNLITNKVIDYAIFNAYHYISHFDFFQDNILDPIWAIQRGPSNKENFVLITNKRFSNQTLKSFHGKNLSLHSDYILMSFYLKYLINQSSQLNISQFFSRIKHTKTASQSILDVYFGVSDLCIVPEHIFNLTVELNPTILDKLTIIHQSSELFTPVLTFAFKHTTDSVKHTINSNLMVLDQSVRGQQILNLFKLQAIKTVSREQLHPMRVLFQKYQALQ